MIAIDDDLAAVLADPGGRLGWSAVFRFPQPRGDFYVSTRPLLVNGVRHEEVLAGLMPVGSQEPNGGSPMRSDSAAGTLVLSNMLVLSTGERVSAVLPSNLEGIVAELWLHGFGPPTLVNPYSGAPLVDSDLEPVGSLLYMQGCVRGDQQNPAAYGYQAAQLRIAGFGEQYLAGQALDTITADEYPYARGDALNQTIPILHGFNRRQLGRVVRSALTQATQPLPDEANSGNATLGGVVATSTAGDQDWIVQFAESMIEQPLSNLEWGAGAKTQPVTFDSATFSGHTSVTSAHTLIWSHNCNTHCGVLLVFSYSIQFPALSVTYAGKPALFLNSIADVNGSIQVYVVIDPTFGTHNVQVNYQTNVSCLGAAISFSEAEVILAPASSAIKTRAGGMSDGVTFADAGPSKSLGLAANDWLVDAMAVVAGYNPLIAGPTAHSPQTQRTVLNLQGSLYLGSSTLNGVVGSLGKGKLLWNWTGDSPPPGPGVHDLTVAARVNRRADVYAYPMTLSGPKKIQSVDVWCRKNPATTLDQAYLYAAIFQDDGAGKPGAYVGSASALVGNTSAAYVPVAFPTALAAAGGNIWVAVWGEEDTTGHPGVLVGISTSPGPSSLLGRYAHASATAVGNYATVGAANFQWIAGVVGDVRFRLQFVAGSYGLVGSLLGADGAGDIATDFVSTSGAISIPSSNWQGAPGGGDRFRFSTSTGTPTVIFAESPPDTPNQSLDDVYMIDGSVITKNPASIVSKEVCVEDEVGRWVTRVTFNADIPNGAQVEADIAGVTDTPDGLYTDTPNSLIQAFSDVIAFWLGERGRVPLEQIDLGDTFTYCRAKQSLYRCNGAVDRKGETVGQTILRLAYESRCELDWSRGVARLLYIQTSGTPGRVVLLDEIARGNDRVPQISIERLPVAEIVNGVDLAWNRRTEDGVYANSRKVDNVDSIEALKARLTRPELGTLDFINDSPAANDHAQFLLTYYGDPDRRRARINGLPVLVAIEKGDVIGIRLIRNFEQAGIFPIDLTLIGNLGDALDNLDGTQPFRVEAKSVDPTTFAVNLVCRELDLE